MPNRDTDLTTKEVKEPIIVPTSPAAQMGATAVRYLVVYLIGSLTAKALIPAELAELVGSEQVINAIVGLVVTGAIAAWGMLKSKRNVAVQQALAAKLDDSIAREG